MVPVETSSEYLANERVLLPEDAVFFFLSLSLCFVSDPVSHLLFRENANGFRNSLPIFWNVDFLHF